MMAMDGLYLTNSDQGLLGEQMVVCDLLKRGYYAFIAPGSKRYDVIAEVSAGRFVRIQVKSTAGIRPRKHTNHPCYFFRVRTGSGHHYKHGEFDVMACVALDLHTVAYLPAREAVGVASIMLSAPGSRKHKRSKRESNIDQLPFEAVLEVL